MADFNRTFIGKRATEMARAQGLGVTVTWGLQEVDLKEKDPDRYTGPGDHVWKMMLCDAESNEFLHSVSFTPREVSFCETNCKEAVDARIEEAIGKIKKTGGEATS